nr:MAG TPA: hypothetical protein [Bacteriophage sp.]
MVTWPTKRISKTGSLHSFEAARKRRRMVRRAALLRGLHAAASAP